MSHQEPEIVKVRDTGSSKAVTIPNKEPFKEFRDQRYLKLEVEWEHGVPFLKVSIIREK